MPGACVAPSGQRSAILRLSKFRLSSIILSPFQHADVVHSSHVERSSFISLADCQASSKSTWVVERSDLCRLGIFVTLIPVKRAYLWPSWKFLRLRLVFSIQQRPMSSFGA